MVLVMIEFIGFGNLLDFPFYLKKKTAAVLNCLALIYKTHPIYNICIQQTVR
jgi:hypothetical protein